MFRILRCNNASSSDLTLQRVFFFNVFLKDHYSQLELVYNLIYFLCYILTLLLDHGSIFH